VGKDLRYFQIKEGGLLPYVDGLLIHSLTQDISNANTVLVLNFLAARGYKVSKSKAQISLQDVHYLGYILAPGAWRLSTERTEAICTLEVLLTKHQLCSFWGVAGFCWIWIPNFGVIAKPLYEATKGLDNEPLKWIREKNHTYKTLKKALTEVPALRIPNLTKPSELYMLERKGTAV
jgi:hypothetical protein